MLSSAPSVNVQWDATRTGSQSLAPASVEIMQAVSGPWKVVTYVNLLDQNAYMGLPSEKNIDALNFEDYVVENPALEMEYIHYYGPSGNEQIFLAYPGLAPNEIAKILAFEWNLDFSDVLSVNELPSTIDFGFERYRYVRAIEWNGKTEVLRVFDDSLVVPTETEISTTLKRLVDGATNVGVAFGQGERSVFQNGILDYSRILSNVSHRDALINQGFSFREIQFGRSVPSDIDILLIADPKMPYTPLQLEMLEEYIGKGGNVAIALEPESDALGSLLSNLGISRKDSSRLRDEHRVDEVATVPTMELNALGFSATRLNAHKPILLSGGAGFHASTDSAFEVVPLLLEEGRDKVTPLAVALRRAVNWKEQRIVVVGDADFMSNSVLAIERKSNNNNQEFIEWVFRWLSQDEYPIDLGRPEFIDRRLLIDSADIPRMKLVAYGVVPGLILLFAARLMIRRRTR